VSPAGETLTCTPYGAKNLVACTTFEHGIQKRSFKTSIPANRIRLKLKSEKSGKTEYFFQASNSVNHDLSTQAGFCGR
jgi:hypothetical protein